MLSREFRLSKNSVDKIFINFYLIILLCSIILITLPIIGDDLIILTKHHSQFSNESFLNQIILEFKFQSNTSENRFLPIGWFVSALLTSLASNISRIPFIDLNLSWSFLRFVLIIISSMFFFKAYSRSNLQSKVTYFKYFTLLILTIQLHALWGHDSILSYTSTVYSNIIFTCIYIIILSYKNTLLNYFFRFIVLIIGLFNYEIFISIFGFILYKILKCKRMKYRLSYLPDVFVITAYSFYLVYSRTSELPTYPGIQISPSILFFPTSVSQILSGLPFISIPLYFRELVTEPFNVKILIAMAITLIVYKNFKIDFFTSRISTTQIQMQDFFGFTAVYIFASILISISAKYQDPRYLIPGFTYTQYSYAWLLGPYILLFIVSSLKSLNSIRILKLLLLSSLFIFISTSAQINDKYQLNDRIIKYVESPSNADSFKSIINLLEKENWPQDYKNQIKSILKEVN